MATSASTIDFLLEQAATAGTLRARKMFGEYALYCDDKVVALVCNDQLFVKPTAPGEAWAGDAELLPAYPGAKPSLHISGDRWDDREWLAQLLRRTADALPASLPKKPSKARAAPRTPR